MTWRAKRSKGPAYVVMRDASGALVRIPVGVIPKIFWPETWYEDPYWMYSGALSREDVAEFFEDPKREIHADFAHKLATYILDYVRNTCAVVWLLNPDRDAYLERMNPCVMKLSELKAKAKCRKDVMDMIHVCLEFAMDPF